MNSTDNTHPAPPPDQPLPSVRQMYSALSRRDASYDGLFLIGVKTTGIFCRPVCGARKPRPENVEYFATAADALQAGFRPCRRCRPLHAGTQPPPWFDAALKLSEQHPDQRIAASDLRAAGLDPVAVARYFKRRFGVTFNAFHRARRLGRALTEVRRGEGVLRAAVGAGFESDSGLRAACQRLFGRPPSRTNGAAGELLRARWLTTALGPMLAVASDAGVCLLEFVSRRGLEAQIGTLRRRFEAIVIPGNNPHLQRLERELAEYFAGRRTDFVTPVVLRGSPFQERVWRVLLQIPAGQTRSYAWVAEQIGRPSAVRAVAQANGANRIAILVPCHRVIGSDGRLTGYGGGLWRKQRLLALEQPASDG